MAAARAAADAARAALAAVQQAQQAARGGGGGLPPGWEAVADGQGGQYYFNSQTLETTWEKPPWLLPGWEAVADGQGGTYYYNAQTQETKWDVPAAPAGADPAEDLARAQEAHAAADAEFKIKDADVAKHTATYNAAERAAQQAEAKAQGSAQAKAQAEAAVKEAAAANDAYQKDAADADSAGITVLKKGGRR